jgi:uncharacterized membrane protein
MGTIPLHPLVVHLPIALVILLPLAAVGGMIAIRRGIASRWAWGAVTALALMLAASAWIAVETGEQQEERVEEVVGDAPLHAHEEAAELFLLLSAAVTGIVALGLAPGRIGGTARAAGLVAALGLVAAGIRVGHSGGELVYEHGAASAYTTPDRALPDVAADRRRYRAGRD